MLVTGIILGPYVLDFLDPSILSISTDLRKMALIIILLKAGLSLDLGDLKKAGRAAVLLSFVPASFEILGYILFAPILLGISKTEAAVMGAVLGAVSPAVVIPRMVYLMERKYGTEKAIPQMIMAGASCDDIFVIVLFTTFLSMAQGGNANIMDFVNIPVSIILGIALGTVTGYGLYLFFETSYAHKHCVRNSMKVIIVLGFAFLLIAIEGWLEGKVAVSGLLALVFRTIGVLLCMAKTKLNWKERIFCVIAYLPKATVQAAIGSVPLAAGLSCGKLVLSVAVLAIIITAPLGAIGIDNTYELFLQKATREG